MYLTYIFIKAIEMRFGLAVLNFRKLILVFIAGVLLSSGAFADSFYEVVNGKRYLCTEQAPQTGPGCQYINGAVYCPGPGQTCNYINGSVYFGYSCGYINGNVYCAEQGGRCQYINGSVYCSSIGQECSYINGAVYCGASCAYINGSVHCSSGGRGTPAHPARPASPSRGG